MNLSKIINIKLLAGRLGPELRVNWRIVSFLMANLALGRGESERNLECCLWELAGKVIVCGGETKLPIELLSLSLKRANCSTRIISLKVTQSLPVSHQ